MEDEKVITKWLRGNDPAEDSIVFSCGSHLPVIADRVDGRWSLRRAGRLVLFSDVVHRSVGAAPAPVDRYVCACGRSFTKAFALTNHRRHCKGGRDEDRD